MTQQFSGSSVNVSPKNASAIFKVVKRDQDDIPDLLYDLLVEATPHPHEEPIREIIRTFVKPRKTYTDDMGNLIIRVYPKKGSNNEGELTTMFSSHMDTMHPEKGKIELIISNNDPNRNKNGIVFGRKSEPIFQYMSLNTEEFVHSIKVTTGLGKLAKKKNKTIKVKANDIFTDKKMAELCRKYDKNFWEMQTVVDENDNPITIIKDDKTFNVLRLAGFQHRYSKESELIGPEFIAKQSGSTYVPSVLGADDKLGCYIMCHLIKNEVPGLYVFHVGEEKGGKGSRWLAKERSSLLKNIQRCIAFDRMNYEDVICNMSPGQTASKTFGNALADQLNLHMPKHKKFAPSALGSWTDSAAYRDIIPECTNLSVAYWNQHTDKEHFDYVWLDLILLPALLKIDWSALPTVRDPKKADPARSSYYNGSGYVGHVGYPNTNGNDADEFWEKHYVTQKNHCKDKPKQLEDKSNNIVSEENINPALKKVALLCNTEGDRNTSEFWGNFIGTISPWEVHENSNWDRIPPWHIKEGLYECKKEAMVQILRKYVLECVAKEVKGRHTLYSADVASLIYDVILEQKEIQNELKEDKEILEDAIEVLSRRM